MSHFSPSDAALEGFRLTRERPGTVLAWGVVYAIGITLIGQLMLAALDPQLMHLVGKRDLSPDDIEAISTMLAKSWPAFLLVLAPVMALTATFQAGIYRLVLRPQEKGFLHLRFGADELRLAAVNVLMVVIGLVCLFVEFIALNLAGQGGGVLALIGAAGILAFTIWVGVRLSLVTPYTFAEHKIDLKGAWGLTRGHFPRLLGMLVLAVIFYIMVWLLITIIAAVLVALAGGAEAISDFRHLSPAALIAFVLYLALELILQVVQVVMISSPLAVAYKQLHADVPGGAPAEPLSA